MLINPPNGQLDRRLVEDWGSGMLLDGLQMHFFLLSEEYCNFQNISHYKGRNKTLLVPSH